MSWKEDEDCCSWDGVTCDSLTGHVIGLDLSCGWLQGNIPSNSSLFLLNHLQKLNLAYNDFNLSQIPPDFNRFTSLTHLNLSHSNFSGQIPSEITHLSKLVKLDLSKNSLETATVKGLVQNLTDLTELLLDSVNMSTVVPSSFMNLSSSLSSLSLSNCELQGKFPDNIFLLPNLKILNLAYNYNLTGILPKVNWSSPLKFLDVSYMTLPGELPNSIGNLIHLTHLDFSSCSLNGSVPISLGNLTKLNYLSLSANNFAGQIPSFLSNFDQLHTLNLGFNNFSGGFPKVFVNLTQLSVLSLGPNQLAGPIPSQVSPRGILVYINLYGNSFNGSIPSWLFTLPLLQFMDLSYNQLSGTIDEFQSKSLKFIYLDNNRLHGSIPGSIFELVNLTSLSLSLNNASGIELYLFSELKKLEGLHLSNTNLSLSTIFNNNSSFRKLRYLTLSACNISEFPDFLRSSHQLESLDLSDNKIHGQLPKWMWDIGKETLYSLNLSHNLLTSIDPLPWKTLRFLDLHSNLIQGPLPNPPPYLSLFSLSNNNLTGEIPLSLCNMSVIQILDLSYNNLNGTIPKCVGNISSLHVLDLRKNRLHGSIPGIFARDNHFRTLNFNGNGLEGSIPRSLVNCIMLEVLDLGNNKIIDSFPYWLGDLPKLQVLVLRFNSFYGFEWGSSKFNGSFPMLRILDLSHNNFGGHLPTRLFENLKGMANLDEAKRKLNYMGEDYYQDSVAIVVKGFEIQLEKIVTTFTAIDLSNNSFHGEIPNSIGKLHSLRLLNLSQNSLTGHIPLSLGNVTALEALDLSSNKLVGEIPSELVGLTFLAKLNLSQNHLEGSIPRGNQFETFQNDSYSGNLGLCGFMLSNKCDIDETPQPESSIDHDEEHNIPTWVDWKVIMMGYGSGLSLGLTIAYIVFSTGKPRWFLQMIDGLIRRCNRKTKRK
ncbi:receptor-like protein 7 [Pistacia vera]|uniref:receptor-like protein 7 n=1 Tax=Pistacia vera TaxID=55513 RepID=UPI001263A273|nr:receptor-like protein 7 [Pistacia vera]